MGKDIEGKGRQKQMERQEQYEEVTHFPAPSHPIPYPPDPTRPDPTNPVQPYRSALVRALLRTAPLLTAPLPRLESSLRQLSI